MTIIFLCQCHPQGTLVLENVLHAPNFAYNILGNKSAGSHHGVTPELPGRQYGEVVDRSGRRLALVHHPDHHQGRFTELLLSGYPTGPRRNPTTFREGTVYFLSAIWPIADRRQWCEHRGIPLPPNLEMDLLTLTSEWMAENQRRQLGQETAQQVAASQNPKQATHIVAVTQSQPRTEPPNQYTAEEKAWLKKNWGGEYKFLRAHGLKIFKDEDREEGMEILRSIMAEGDQSDFSDVEDTSRDGSPHLPKGKTFLIGACWPAMGQGQGSIGA